MQVTVVATSDFVDDFIDGPGFINNGGTVLVTHQTLSSDQVPPYIPGPVVNGKQTPSTGVYYYYYNPPPHYPARLPSGDNKEYDPEQLTRSLDSRGYPPISWTKPTADPAATSPQASVWGALSIAPTGASGTIHSQPSEQLALNLAERTCREASDGRQGTCITVAVQNSDWAFGLSCKYEKNMTPFIGVGPTAEEAQINAYQTALSSGTFRKEDCKLRDYVQGNGAYLQRQPEQQQQSEQQPQPQP